MLFNVREFINIDILKSIYHAIFDCHLNYGNTIWGRSRYSMNILCFKHEIIKLSGKFVVENFLFISKSINFNIPSIFNHWSKLKPLLAKQFLKTYSNKD